MEAPLVFPDIDRRIAALAVAVLCALLLGYLAYVWAEKALSRARMADAHAAIAHDLAKKAYLKADLAQRSLAAPRQRKRK